MIESRTVTCEKCNGTGWLAVEGTLRAVPCACQAATKKDQRITSSAIPRRYFHCTLQNFHEHHHFSQASARRRVQEFVDCWPITEDQRGLLLMGSCGVGKTHLAVALLMEIIRADKPGKLLFSNFQDLIQEIHASFDSEERPSKWEILRPLIETDLLVLDELGSQKPTQFVQDILYYIINSRYNDQRVTIFTTNYVDEPQAKEETLEERIGRRLRSRLHEMTDSVVMSGEDYRKRRKSTI